MEPLPAVTILLHHPNEPAPSSAGCGMPTASLPMEEEPQPQLSKYTTSCHFIAGQWWCVWGEGGDSCQLLLSWLYGKTELEI